MLPLWYSSTGERQHTRQNLVALIVPWTLFFLCTIGAVFIAGFLCLLKHFTKVTPESRAEGSHSQLQTDRTRELDEDLFVKRELDEDLSVKRELDEDLSVKRELDEDLSVKRELDEDLSVKRELDEDLSVKRELDEDLSVKRELDEERDMDEDLSVISLTQ